MDNITPWIIIGIGIVLLIIGLIFVWLYYKKQKTHKPDYFILFMFGLIWIPLGIPLGNYAMSIMGIVFAIVGLLHKKEWKKNRMDWNKVDKKQRKLQIIAASGMMFALIVAILILLAVKYNLI